MKTKRMFFTATMAITRIVLFIWLLINRVLMNITHHQQGTSFSFLLEQMQALFLLAHSLGKRRTNLINGYLNLRRSKFSGLNARRSTTTKRKRVCWNSIGRSNHWMLSNDTDEQWLKKFRMPRHLFESLVSKLEPFNLFPLIQLHQITAS